MDQLTAENNNNCDENGSKKQATVTKAAINQQ